MGGVNKLFSPDEKAWFARKCEAEKKDLEDRRAHTAAVLERLETPFASPDAIRRAATALLSQMQADDSCGWIDDDEDMTHVTIDGHYNVMGAMRAAVAALFTVEL